MVDPKYYPFGKGKIQIKFPETHKIGLNADEIELLEKAELDEKENHARNLWMFSYLLAGMRISDVLRVKWHDFQNNRFFYQMGKNNKVFSLEVDDRVMAIIHSIAVINLNTI